VVFVDKQDFISSMHESHLNLQVGYMSQDGFKKAVQNVINEATKAVRYGSLTFADMIDICAQADKLCPEIINEGWTK
jgi:hypothetical protein